MEENSKLINSPPFYMVDSNIIKIYKKTKTKDIKSESDLAFIKFVEKASNFKYFEVR